MQITLKDCGSENKGPDINVKLIPFPPNGLALRLSHPEEEPHHVMELYIDYFDNKLQLCVYDIDEDAMDIEETLELLASDPPKIIPLCDDWRNHKLE